MKKLKHLVEFSLSPIIPLAACGYGAVRRTVTGGPKSSLVFFSLLLFFTRESDPLDRRSGETAIEHRNKSSSEDEYSLKTRKSGEKNTEKITHKTKTVNKNSNQGKAKGIMWQVSSSAQPCPTYNQIQRSADRSLTLQHSWQLHHRHRHRQLMEVAAIVTVTIAMCGWRGPWSTPCTKPMR